MQYPPERRLETLESKIRLLESQLASERELREKAERDHNYCDMTLVTLEADLLVARKRAYAAESALEKLAKEITSLASSFPPRGDEVP